MGILEDLWLECMSNFPRLWEWAGVRGLITVAYTRLKSNENMLTHLHCQDSMPGLEASVNWDQVPVVLGH